MPADNEFRFSQLFKSQVLSGYNRVKRGTCIRESLFNGAFSAVAGFVFGYIYYNNARKATLRGAPLAAFTGFYISLFVCYRDKGTV